MPRRKIDWEEELEKTERIRRRGFRITALSLAFIAMFFMGNKFQNYRLAPPFYVVMVLLGLLGIVLIYGRRK
ncbi:MAG: hypothetical protein ABC360_03075 [Acetomicrobium sp.]